MSTIYVATVCILLASWLFVRDLLCVCVLLLCESESDERESKRERELLKMKSNTTTTRRRPPTTINSHDDEREAGGAILIRNPIHASHVSVIVVDDVYAYCRNSYAWFSHRSLLMREVHVGVLTAAGRIKHPRVHGTISPPSPVTAASSPEANPRVHSPLSSWATSTCSTVLYP